MMKVNKILKIRNIFLLAIVLAVGSYMILFVYNSFFKTTDIPFKYKIESIEMERVTFGQDSMTLKKYLMKIRLSDEDVQSKHYPLLHYMNGIKDSVVSVAVKDINGKDISGAFDCAMVNWRYWDEPSNLNYCSRHNWETISDLRTVLNSLNTDLQEFDKVNGMRQICIIYTLPNTLIPNEMIMTLEKRKIKCKIRNNVKDSLKIKR